jgi:hypothetical protein
MAPVLYSQDLQEQKDAASLNQSDTTKRAARFVSGLLSPPSNSGPRQQTAKPTQSSCPLAARRDCS